MIKVVRSIALLLLALFPVLQVGAADSTPLRIVSFNIRCTNPHDGTNSWELRRQVFFDEVNRLAPAIIGFQEVRPDQYQDIVGRLKRDFDFVGVARDDGKNEGERALVAYDKRRFKKIKTGNFWFSETPEVPGSKSWDTAITRVCTWVRLKDKTTRREFLFVNTHFDHKGVLARENSSRMLVERLPDLAKGRPIILTGDFNVHEDSAAYTKLMNRKEGVKPWLMDSYRELHPSRSAEEASFNGFNDVTRGSRIDFIFHTPDIKPVSATIEHVFPQGRFASDHYAITAVLEFKE
ncbi:MAG: putative endonuclease/exonuclease/phosphatase family protein [Verrucomicrobiales bacterium]|nr:putative endonuclease/exonuclease/phosphatase family protein [Verrucomicrobiales bacterium]